MATQVPLKRFWFGRRSWIGVDRRMLDVVLRPYFGREPWRLDVAGVAVVDLRSAATVGSEPPVFERLPILPSFVTTAQLRRPTTTFLFDEPRRLPPMRVGSTYNAGMPFTARQTRAGHGVLVDGFSVRLADPDVGLATLAAAGVEVVSDADAWFATRRPLVPARLAATVAARRRGADRWFAAALFALFGATTLAVPIATGAWPAWLWPVAAALAVLVVVFGRRAKRAAEPASPSRQA